MALVNKSFEDLFEFSRASEATYVDSDGLIKIAGVDEPRFDHDPLSGESKGVLIEGSVTNTVRNSTDFSWIDESGSNGVEYYTDTEIMDPAGGFSATRVIEVAGDARLATASTPSTGVRSVWARTVSGAGSVRLLVMFNKGESILFDLDEHWRRVYLYSDHNQLHLVDFRGGSTLSEVLVWGLQIEGAVSGDLPSSYIPTNGSPVTRAEEQIAIVV